MAAPTTPPKSPVAQQVRKLSRPEVNSQYPIVMTDKEGASGEFPLDHGSIFFKMHRADADAEFVRCRLGVDKSKLVKHALDVWQLPEPGVLLRVCGSKPSFSAAADFSSALEGVWAL